MKKLANIMLGLVIFTAIVIISGCTFYNYNLTAPKNSKEKVIVEIPKGASTKKVASILKEKKLIRNDKIFLIYVKLMSEKGFNYGTYEIPYNSGVKKIVKMLEEVNTYNPDQINITFKEGKTMRDIARLIEANTNNSYDDVIKKSNDMEYINKVIEKYWFITDDIKNNNLYYKLEGYLFPDTYSFNNKDVTVEEIFNKMLDEMAKKLEPLRADITKNKLSVHELLTLASMIEKETPTDSEYKNNEASLCRRNVASVFINRINKGMSLGSDVTTRYAVKVDNNTQALTKNQYATASPYNTRLTDGSMNGKLPVGPIGTISLASLKAAINPTETDYIYFIANIETSETFFFNNSASFEAKKNELKSVNRGL